LATRRYPTYEVGIQLNFPLRNRVAQADATRDELSLRASEARVLMIQNQAELEAEAALIALKRARSSYDAAARTLRLRVHGNPLSELRRAGPLHRGCRPRQLLQSASRARSLPRPWTMGFKAI